MSRLLRLLRRTAIGLAAVAAAFVVAVQLRWQRRFDVPYETARHASGDSTLVARGRYLVYGPAHCASCHVSPSDRGAFVAGGEPPLAGGGSFRLPVGTWHMANLTADRATGIGARSDADVARTLRHGVRRDGRVLIGMEFGRLADEDVDAVLSFLRTQPAVRNVVPAREVGFLARALAAFVITPKTAPPARAAAPEEVGVARGEYVANALAGCGGCHTARSHRTGRYTGPQYGGGSRFVTERGEVFVSPSLRAAGPGPIAAWTEDQFVARLKRGRVLTGSPMHWESFSRMSEPDLRAVYRYLKTL